MNEVSPYICSRVSANSTDEFEGPLYDELVNRLGEVRKTTGVQIPLSDWKAWIVPILTVAAILGLYFFWVIPTKF